MLPDTFLGLDARRRGEGPQEDASRPETRTLAPSQDRPAQREAASLLLNRAPPEGYLEEWTSHVARRSVPSSLSPGAATGGAAEEAATLSVMIFRLGSEWLALPTRLLEEVTEMRPVHSLPRRRSGVVLGVTNIHGGVLICVSLAVLLGLPPEAPPHDRRMEARRRMLVIGRDSGRFVFPADEVHGIQRYQANKLRSAPATVARAGSSYSRHVLPWQDRSVGYLDADLLLDGLNRSVA